MTIKWRFEYTNIGDCYDNSIKLSKKEKNEYKPLFGGTKFGKVWKRLKCF